MSSVGPQERRVLLGGGIGAGKSSIAVLFVDAGFSLIESDRVGADVLAPGTPATTSVADAWPNVVSGDIVDREALARIVFSFPGALERLEAITHPAIRAEIERRVAEVGGDFVVEVPLTTLDLQGGWVRVAVVASEETRIARAVARGGERDDVRRRVAAQVSEDAWVEWADVVVNNSGSWAATERAVAAVIEGLGS